MPQNKQEHLVALMTKYSVGSAFVFEPDEFRKGNTTREPADLVWHCNECTVLIYMRYFQKDKGVHRNQNKSKKCSNHNLDQAKGWIREWRLGRNLVGRNEHQEFSIKYGDQQHIVVLSVVDGSNCLAKYHKEFVRDYKVSCCGTIPQNAFEELIKHGASSIDLIHCITKMRNILDYIEESTCIDYVKTDFINIARNIDPTSKWIGKSDDRSYDYMTKMMKSLVYHQKDKKLIEFAARISDLPLMDYWTLITSMLEQREYSRVNTKVWWSRIRLPVSDIHVVLATGSMNGVSENLHKILKFNEPLDGKTPTFILTWLFLGGEQELTMVGVNDYDRDYEPYTKRYLDAFLGSDTSSG